MENIEPIIQSTQSVQSNPKNPYKILFFLSLGLFLIVASVLITLLITQKSSKPIQTINTEKTELSPTETIEINQEVTPTEITTTSTSKTAFQKMITDVTLYKDITTTERNLYFPSSSNESSFWPSYIKSGDKLYSFVQKLNKGSIKTLTIDHSNLDTILTDENFKDGYNYTFYLTPNYEKWTNTEFKNLNYEATGLGDLTPLYASSDKLFWTTRTNCGGARPIDIEGQKVQNQCDLLIKEAETAFP